MGGLSEMRVDPTRATTVHAMVRTGRQGTCGNSSAVERQPSKLGVAGSNPVSRSIDLSAAASSSAGGGRSADFTHSAHVAQLAEHALGKGEVSGSIPDMGSRYVLATKRGAHGR